MKCTPSATACKVPFPILASKTGSTTSSRASLGLQHWGDLALLLWRVGGLRLLENQLPLLCPWFQGLTSAVFLGCSSLQMWCSPPRAAERGALLRCHNQVSCEQQKCSRSRTKHNCSHTKHSCSRVCQQVLVRRKQRQWYQDVQHHGRQLSSCGAGPTLGTGQDLIHVSKGTVGAQDQGSKGHSSGTPVALPSQCSFYFFQLDFQTVKVLIFLSWQ